MHFTTEHNQLRDTIAKFVATEINPHVEAWEKAEEFPSHELFKKMGDLGLLGLRWPEKFGGAGLDFSYALVLAEELGRAADVSVALASFEARRWERCRMVVQNSARLGEIEVAGGDKEEHSRIMRESLMALAQPI